MEQQHNVIYEEGNEEVALEKKQTALTVYFNLNKIDPVARNILYKNIPQHYRLDVKKTWIKRKKNEQVIGRVCSISPKDSERFYLKLLLNFIPGATCYNDLKIYEGKRYESFREVAIARNLLHTEAVVYEIFDEAVEIMMPNQLRLLYSTYLTGEQPATALDIWEKYKKYFCEGFNDNHEYRALQHISSILEAENFMCKHFNLPEPDVDL